MVNPVKVTPGCISSGMIKAQVGRFRVNPANKQDVPIRFVQYSPNNGNDLIGWHRIASGEVPVAPDSVLCLDNELLRDFLRPQGGIPGGLLILKEQLAAEVIKTLKQMVPVLEQFSPWMFLLPYISENGRNAAFFTLPTTGASPQEATAFTSQLDENIRLFEQQDGGNVLFINLYHQEWLKTS